MNKRNIRILLAIVSILIVGISIFYIYKNKKHEYFCDKFIFTADKKQYDLSVLEPDLSSVSALQPITDRQLFILGRIDENTNLLLIYDFKKEDFVFSEYGTMMCWIQDKEKSVRYLKDNVVYDLKGNIIYKPEPTYTITMIEYVEEDFVVTITELEHKNTEQVLIE